MAEITRKAPSYLRAATRRWWVAVITTWDLEEHHIRLLTLACEAWDRGQQAREAIAKHGLTTPTRESGMKLSPLVRVEQESRIAFARLVRELDLDVSAPSETKRRPPMLRSIRGGGGDAA